jgi:hypothetical protein
MPASKMIKAQSRRFIYSRPRPKTVLILALALITTYVLVFRGPSVGYHIIPWQHGAKEIEADPESEPEGPLTAEEKQRLEKEKYEEGLRDQFRVEYEAAKR